MTRLVLVLVFLLAPASALANTPPVAEDDVYDTDVDLPLSVPAPGVLDNDLDEDGDLLEAVLVDQPEKGGTVELQADGSFDYSPPAGYVGNEAFTYMPWDGTAFGNLAEVTVRIGAPPDPYTLYFDEATFLADLADLGHVAMAEGFEDEMAWGSARSPSTQPTVPSQGIIWTSNNDVSDVTTGSGPALTGTYGFFCLPHGNYSSGTACHIPGTCTDGWIATASGVLYGAGGWIEGNFRQDRVLPGRDAGGPWWQRIRQQCAPVLRRDPPRGLHHVRGPRDRGQGGGSENHLRR